MSLSVFTARCTVVVSIGANSGVALERDVGRLHFLLVDARRLRHLREQHRFGRPIGARHRREHARSRMLERNLLEVGGQRRRGKRPRPGEVRRREPAAGDQVVDRPVLPIRKTSLSVLLTHSRPVPGTGDVLRRAGQENQLRRLQADEHLGDGRRGDRLARQVRADVVPVLVRRQLLEAVGQRAGRRPGPLDVVGSSTRSSLFRR